MVMAPFDGTISSKSTALKLEIISSAPGAATALGYGIGNGTSGTTANNICSRAAALSDDMLCRSPLSYHYLHDQRAHACIAAICTRRTPLSSLQDFFDSTFGATQS
jgi:hypothetical protein